MTTPSTEDSPRRGLRLVFGASGYIGTNLVPRLVAEGLPVRATSRRLAVLEARRWPGVELCAADALAPETLPAALDGVDTAYYLVHSMAAGGDFGRLDVAAAGHFARAAAVVGVRRIVYVGGLIPEDAASEHLQSRRSTGDELRQGPVPVTELRAGIVVGPGSAAFEVMRDLVFHLPVMITPRWVRAKSPPIALDNLLDYLLRLPEIDAAANRIFDAAGPERMSYEDMMRIVADVAGRRRPLIIPVPVLTPKLSSYWLKWVTSAPTEIAQALIGGLEHEFYADPEPLRALVPLRLLSFRESVEATFAAERDGSVAARWVEGAFAVRQGRTDYSFYAKHASGGASTRAAPAALWTVLSRIGGNNRYFYMNPLWTLRETIDWLLGGSALKRGRRDPDYLRVGDKVDSWDVVVVERERRLSLAFGMKAPGAGLLDFEIEPRGDGGSEITVTAHWHPAGVFGLLYWYALEPVHRVIFKGMARELCRRAEALEAGRDAGKAPVS